MNNINLNIASTDNLINEILQSVPIGVAYLILKTKLNQIEKLYLKQIQYEYQQNNKQNQEDVAILKQKQEQQLQKDITE